MHEIKSGIDLGEWHSVSDHLVYVDFAFHISVHNHRHVGAASGAAEGGAPP